MHSGKPREYPPTILLFEKGPGPRGVARMKTKTRDLLATVLRMLQHADFRNQVKQHPQDFSRQRKVGFVSLVSIILNYGASYHPTRMG